jgi:uncharacterized protein (DUF1015 family)
MMVASFACTLIAWFRKEKAPKSKERETKRVQKEAKKDVESDDEGVNGEQWQKIGKDDASRPLFDSKVDINADAVMKKLVEINSSRGKKSTNRKTYVKLLQELYRIADEKDLGVGVLVGVAGRL